MRSYLNRPVLLVMLHSLLDNLLPLDQLAVGQSAVVALVAGERDYVHRLGEFGLRAGRPVRMVRRGSPCIIALDGQKVCLRAGDIASVLVKLESAR